jgi:hypothetical protein
MGDESTKRAAQEYLAAKLSEEGQQYEDKLNAEAAIKLAPAVWKSVVETVIEKCNAWNAVTGEQTFSCKETVLGDIRILCSGRPQQMTVHCDSDRRLISIKNTARLEHEPQVILRIEGYPTDAGREAHLVRNNQPVNFDMLILGQLRVLAGLRREANG